MYETNKVGKKLLDLFILKNWKFNCAKFIVLGKLFELYC